MASRVEDNQLGNKVDMTVYVFAGADNTFNLYEDEGDGNSFKNGECVTTEFNLKWGENAKFTVKPAYGNTDIIPSRRNWDIKLRGFAKEIEVRVNIEGKEIPCKTVCDLKTNTISVILENISVSNEIIIEVMGEKLMTDNAGVTDRLYDILLHSQMDYVVKSGLWYAFKGKSNLLYKACPQREYAEILSAAEEMRKLLNF